MRVYLLREESDDFVPVGIRMVQEVERRVFRQVGLGIINISQLYGVGAIRNQKEVQLIVKLEDWDSSKAYDRLGTDQTYQELLGVKIPVIEIPVRPGRNLPIIIEAAAMNERLKDMGYNAAKDFNENVLKWIETGDAKTAYYGHDNSY